MTPFNLTSLRIENVKSNFYSDLLVGKSHFEGSNQELLMD